MPRRVVRPLADFLRQEATGAVVLGLAVVAALVWANVAAGGYTDLWGTELTLRIGDWTQTESLRHVVNEGLMTLFFLVIGLEVKRELTVGELRGPRAAALPAAAALGGMLLPALIYLAVVGAGGGADAAARGWGIPIATDVAFALGALLALRSRVPPGLVALLLGVAVIDDIGAVIVIAFAYTDAIALGWLAGAAAGCAAIALASRRHVRWIGAYVVLGVVVWACTFQSGVHATIAGVALGLLTPARPFQPPAAVSAEAYRVADLTPDAPESPDADADHWRRLSELSREAISPLNRVEHGLHQWSSLVVLPLFALANAGIALGADALDAAVSHTVTVGVVAGLVAGKVLGLTGGAALAVRLGLGTLPTGVRMPHVLGVGALAGIGFTVSLLVAELAFADAPDLLAAARIGILAGSVLAASVGVAILLAVARRDRRGAAA